MPKLTTLDELIASLPQEQQDKIHKLSEQLISEIDLKNIESEVGLAEKLGVFDIVN
ncbi:hypothetical protein PTQ27_01040 [Mannheimia sp. AT1]|uniref:Uncharacterized protein n=1 Tax=Mannheimia cairinae TaxID=3025936 RepID=A0ABT5MNL2_9PAST|nr:hypothetical protein [Mannheimia cairinae]MDD0823059.1 hypothetical protein [Mannheimia cairinae]MDD0825916.1 hypothetical protein [Mannheimia cairinae]